MKSVNSGKILDFINDLLKTIDKVFDSLERFSVEEIKSNNKNEIIRCLWYPKDKPKRDVDPSYVIYVKIVTSEDGKTVDMYFRTGDKDSRNNKKFEGVSNNSSDIQKIIDNYIEDIYPDDYFNSENMADTEEDTNGDYNFGSSVKLSLKKIVADSDTTVELTSLYSNYSPSETLDDVQSLLYNDDFVSEIPDSEEVCYELVPSEDSLDIELIEEIPSDFKEKCSPLIGALLSAYEVYFSCLYKNAILTGPQFSELKSTQNSLSWTVSDHINSIYGLFSELNYNTPYVPDMFVGNENCTDVLANIDNYLASLEVLYVNVPHDIKTMIDRWIRDVKVLKHQIFELS